MLRLSKKAEYALMALKDLASRPAAEAASARDIAERYGIPVEVLAKVLQRLAKQHLLVSQHGTRGGYLLARPASRISVGDAIAAIDGPVTVTVCSSADDDCDQYATCNIRDPLWRVKDQIGGRGAGAGAAAALGMLLPPCAPAPQRQGGWWGATPRPRRGWAPRAERGEARMRLGTLLLSLLIALMLWGMAHGTAGHGTATCLLQQARHGRARHATA